MALACRRRCSHCKKAYATIRCHENKCNRAYHLACAIERKVHFQFADAYDSYCNAHKKIDDSALTLHQPFHKCYICSEALGEYDPITSIPSCCDQGWYHLMCAKQAAVKSGYLLHCPTCGRDKDGFRYRVAMRGVYTPNIDAAWELTQSQGNKPFESLLFVYRKCDAEKCLCEKGRDFHRGDGDWAIKLCNFCGSKGVHEKCSQSNESEFECDDCHIKSQTQNAPAEDITNGSISVQQEHADSDDEQGRKLVDTKTIEFKKRTLDRNEIISRVPLNSAEQRKMWIERTKAFFDSMKCVNGYYYPKNKYSLDKDVTG